jgi:hypothetical protein
VAEVALVADGRWNERGERALGANAPRVRGDEGAALIEFAILLPFLSILVFGTIDLARAYQFQNRLTNAAREGAAFAQFRPLYVGTTGAPNSCNSGENIAGRVLREDPDLVLHPTEPLVVERKEGDTDALTPYTGCPAGIVFDSANNDEVVVTVRSEFDVLTPLIAVFVGETIDMEGQAEAVVQG